MRSITQIRWLSAALLFVTFSMSLTAQAERQYLSNSKGLTHDELGQLFTQLVSEHKFSDADKLINYVAYSKRVAKKVFDSETQRAAFTRGFMQSIKQASFSEKIFIAALTESTKFKYLGVNENGTPVVRIDYTEGGHEYLKLITRSSPKGKLLINDFMFASTGELSSVGAANATKYLVQPSESILKRLLGGTEPNEELITAFKKLASLRAQGKNKPAYELVQTFPDKIRNEREFLQLSIALASTFDDDVYRAELSKLDQLYGHDPKHAFMLIDHYFYQEDWGKALYAIKASKKEWADDGALNILLAQILTRDGQLDAAVRASERAVGIEPNNEFVYWSALTSYNNMARYDDAMSALTALKEQFSYDFESGPFVENPEYYDLLASDAYKAWVGK